MKMQDIYDQKDMREIERFMDQVATCLLVTRADGDRLQFGVFGFGRFDGTVLLHLNRTDEQVWAMRARPNATLIFQDILTISPSYWTNPNYGGAATAYYRYAELETAVTLVEDTSHKIECMKKMLDRYQPEGGYDAIDHESPIYAPKLDTIVVAQFTIVSCRAKWRLGQHVSAVQRRSVAERFRQRGETRCAEEILRWIDRHSS